MGLVKNFQKDDVAKALDLLLHMVRVLRDGEKPDALDMNEVARLISEIKASR